MDAEIRGQIARVGFGLVAVLIGVALMLMNRPEGLADPGFGHNLGRAIVVAGVVVAAVYGIKAMQVVRRRQVSDPPTDR